MSQMARVSKENPCKICSRTDWCIYGLDVSVCMRIPSPRSKTFIDGSVGYIHALDGATPVREFARHKAARELPILNPDLKLKKWKREIGHACLPVLATQLGVSFQSLFYLGCQRTNYYKTWAFPMRNASNAIVGIRLRSEDGNKWAEKGSHQGLFLPQMDPQPTVYLVEGPTDTAAALTLGVFAIGRPSCNGGVTDLLPALKRLGIRKAVIVADTDNDKERLDANKQPTGEFYNPGVDGAMNLSEQLVITNCTLLLPCKDIRQFLIQGGTKKLLESMTANCVWRKPK